MEHKTSVEAMSLFVRGERFYQFGELHAAEETLVSAIYLDSSFAEAWNLLGIIRKSLGKPDEARRCFREASKYRPEWVAPYSSLGELEIEYHNFVDALNALKNYHHYGGREVDVLLDLANVAFQMGDYELVISVTADVLDIDGGIYRAWEIRGLCQARLGHYDAADVSLNMAIELNPSSIVALNTVGDLCYESENYIAAIQFYTTSLQVDNRQPDVLLKMGTSLWFVGRWQDAIFPLEQYTDLRPSDPKGWNNLGVVLREKGLVKRAIECFNKALKIDSAFEAAIKNLENASRRLVLL